MSNCVIIGDGTLVGRRGGGRSGLPPIPYFLILCVRITMAAERQGGLRTKEEEEEERRKGMGLVFFKKNFCRSISILLGGPAHFLTLMKFPKAQQNQLLCAVASI